MPRPTLTTEYLAPPATVVGVRVGADAVEPFPSWPYELSPQQSAAPSVVTPHVLSNAAPSETKRRAPATGSALYVRGDTVYGTVGGVPRRIPLADVEQVKVVRKNAALTAAATVSVLALTGAAVWAMVSNAPNLGGSIGGGGIRWP